MPGFSNTGSQRRSFAVAMLAAIGMASLPDAMERKSPVHARRHSNQRVLRKRARWVGGLATNGK